MVLSRAAEERLFDAALENEAQASARGPSVFERLREEERLRERNAAMRRAFQAVPGGSDALATIDGLVAGTPPPEAASPRTEGEREALIRDAASKIPMGLEALESFRRERELRALNDPAIRTLPLPRGGPDVQPTPLPLTPRHSRLRPEPIPRALPSQLPAGPEPRIRERFSPRPSTPRALDALRETQRLRERNAAMRRAFGAVPGGPEALATLEMRVEATRPSAPPRPQLSRDAEERLFEAELAIEERSAAAGPPSVVREVQRALAAESEAEREALIRDIASKIPMGIEALDSFRREQAFEAQEEVIRRTFLGVPGGAELLAQRDAVIAATERGLQEVVPEFGPQAGPPSPQALPEAEERLFEAELAVDLAGANPATGVRSDLVSLLGDMFALVTSTPFETSPRTLRAFSDEGANGRTAEGRFREISAALGFSSAQTDRLIAGASLAEVGPPRPTVSGVRGAFALL